MAQNTSRHGRQRARARPPALVGALAHRLELPAGPEGVHQLAGRMARTRPGSTNRPRELFANDRGVLGVGVETVGTDAGQAGTFTPPFPNHTIMHGAGKFGLTSLCNLDRLPPTGAVVIAAPLRIVDGSGSPVRVLALVPA